MKLHDYEMRTKEEILAAVSDPERTSTQEESPLRLVVELLLDIRQIAIMDYKLRRAFIGGDDELDEIEALMRSVPEGERHNVLFGVAVRVREKLERPESVLQQIAVYNAQFCTPPLPDQEVEQIVTEAYNMPIEQVRKFAQKDEEHDAEPTGVESGYSPSDRRRGN
jgi:hypothetical protein